MHCFGIQCVDGNKADQDWVGHELDQEMGVKVPLDEGTDQLQSVFGELQHDEQVDALLDLLQLAENESILSCLIRKLQRHF